MIARWVVKDNGFVDILNLGGSLSNFTRHRANMFKVNVLSPASGRQLGRALSQGYRSYLSKLQDQNDITRDHRQWQSDYVTGRKVSIGAGGK